MALKDWKLIVNDKLKKSWEHKKEDEKEIMITPFKFQFPKGEWEASYLLPEDSPSKLSKWKTKRFKNKKAAETFAKKFRMQN